MYHLTNVIPSDSPLSLLLEVAFNPSGTLFAVSHGQANEVVVFDAHTRSVLRVYQNPDARLDNPHGVLLTDKHIIVGNAHGALRPSTFTIYNLDDPSQMPVSVYETPYQHLREAHSLDRRNNILVVTYPVSADGRHGAVVSYRFDDEAGMICGPICMRESFFTQYGEPKGVAFNGDSSQIFFTFCTEHSTPALINYPRRLKMAWQVWRSNGAAEFFRYLCSKAVKVYNARRMRGPELKNGIAIFDISDGGVLSEQPVRVLQRALYCRLENIQIVGETALLADTINGRVDLHDLAQDPLLETPVYTITDKLTLPHGAKLSPDQTGVGHNQLWAKGLKPDYSLDDAGPGLQKLCAGLRSLPTIRTHPARK